MLYADIIHCARGLLEDCGVGIKTHWMSFPLIVRSITKALYYATESYTYSIETMHVILLSC